MKIKFKKSKLFGNLLLGAVWFGIGMLNFYDADKSRWSFYVYLVLGILYIGHFINDLSHQYLTIDNGTLRRNWLYGLRNKIYLNDIKSIKKDNANYILITDTQKLKIKTKWIEENSLNELYTILENLNLPSERSPFAEVI